MTTRPVGLGRVFRPHRLLVAARIAFALWIASWIVYGVLTMVHASAELLFGIGAIICTLFATGFGLRVVAARMIMRELRTSTTVDELIASRSRRAPRVL